MRGTVLLAALLCACAQHPALAAVADGCSSLLPRHEGGQSTPPSAETLIELHDIGYPAPIPQAVTLSPSPDGRHLAFPIQQAHLARNDDCSGIVVLDIDGGHARLVGAGPGLAMASARYRGPVVPEAVPAFVKALWSPDGQWLAFLRSVDGKTSLWRARADGSDLLLVPGTGALVDNFTWSDDGARLIVSDHPGLAKQESDLKTEGLAGYHFDQRFLPFAASRPFPMPVPARTVSIDLASGMIGGASPADVDRLGPVNGAHRTAPGMAERSAWLAPEYEDRVGSRQILHLSDHGKAVACPDDRCADVTDFWWSGDGRSLAFLRKEGWRAELTALYRWSPGHDRPHRLLVTRDMLIGCARASRALFCAREGATSPRHIVAIALDTGRTKTLFDPNPDYAGTRTQAAERLHWTTARGDQVIGDLVLPVGYQRGRRYPLIIVNYETRGFLRGATGDEYPIQLFAANGFAVLSIDRPRDVGFNVAGTHTPHDVMRIDLKDWADRANIESAVERGARLLVDRGIVDPARVGISGLSDGAETAAYAVIHYPRLAAASLGSCCNEPESYLAAGGPAAADDFRALGYPDLMAHDARFWMPASLAYNARTIRTPVLMQLPDFEFGVALQGLEALREAKAPVDAYIFPDEGHVKLAPRHRLAVYQRNLAWFDFWLRDVRDTNFATAETYARWERMRYRATPVPAAAPRQ